MSLTHYAALNARPREKHYRLSDGQGLYLQVSPTGRKWWRFKYRFGGRENCLSVGKFPAVALKTARERCLELRAQLAAGVDPAVERRVAKQKRARQDESFEVLAREWYATFSRNWTPSHGDRVLRRLESYVFPWVGKMPIREVTAMNVLECLRRLEQQNTHETARRVLRYCSQTLRYAIITGRAETDVLSQLRGALAPRKTQHLASIKDPKEVGALLRAIDGYDGRLVTKFALRFAPLVFVRPGELRHAAWKDFDFLQREWRIPADQMKARQPHIVPLSSQAMALLRELQPLTGATPFLFPVRHLRQFHATDRHPAGVLLQHAVCVRYGQSAHADDLPGWTGRQLHTRWARTGDLCSGERQSRGGPDRVGPAISRRWHAGEPDLWQRAHREPQL